MMLHMCEVGVGDGQRMLNLLAPDLLELVKRSKGVVYQSLTRILPVVKNQELSTQGSLHLMVVGGIQHMLRHHTGSGTGPFQTMQEDRT